MNRVLIVVDMQNDFISGSLSNPITDSVANKIAGYIKDFDGEILFTQDTHEENYLSTRECRELPVKHCIRGTWGHEIDDRLKEAALKKHGTVRSVHKYTFGANPDCYRDYFKGCKEEDIEIEICGTLVDICVITNALILKTLFPNAEIKLLVDLCGYRNVQDLIAATRIANACQIEIVYN